MSFICPVCGYNKLRRLPEDFLICPSCGTEFGYQDAARTPEDIERRRKMLRDRWITSGPHGPVWHSRYVPEPANWDPYGQLRALGLVYEPTVSTRYQSTSTESVGELWRQQRPVYA
jgi:hypothetical protein